MAYSQPDSNIPQLEKAAFFRITQVSTPGGGDIWESLVGGFAFCVGPLSDYANYEVTYRDGQVAGTALAQGTFSANRPFAGLVYARNDSQGNYLLSNRPGRIFIAPQDIFNNSPPPGLTVNDRRWIEYPVIDVLQYLVPQTVLPTARPDKHIRYQELELPSTAGASFYLQIPYYGRRYASIGVANRSGVSVDIQITGMTFTTATEDASPIFTDLGAAVTIADAGMDTIPITAAEFGMFDYLIVQVEVDNTPSSNEVSLDLYLSDVPA